MKIAVLGNCQVEGLTRCLQVMAPTCEVFAIHLGIQMHAQAFECDVILLQTEFYEPLRQSGILASFEGKTVISWPTFYFPAFHPDLVYVHLDKGVAQSPLGDYHSSIIFYAWRNGLSVGRTEALFCEPVFQHLGFFDYWQTSKQALLDEFSQSHLDLAGAFDRWTARGCFSFSVNHPKLFVIGSIASAIVDKLGIVPTTRRPEDFLYDAAADACVWPVYPAIGRRLGLDGDYAFKVSRHLCTADQPVRFLGLRAFIEASFANYEVYPREELRCDRLVDREQLYCDIEEVAAGSRRKSSNPYSGLPAFCFWRSGVAEPVWHQVDPVVQTKFKLSPSDRIATAGSCFAQHIARTLVTNGYNYYVAEAAPAGMPPEQAAAGSYGLFSARYGNVYTARQMLQLVDRASGEFIPRDIAWRRRDGHYIDPFRPQVERHGFANAAAVIAARECHFAAVRRLFETMDVFVFTIGLTESWRARADGAVFPVAPGAVAIDLDPAAYEFVNFSVAEIRDDMRAFIAKLQGINPRLRIIVTVSPVPLVATYEKRHVLVSTTYSKSVLRVVAAEITAEFDHVDYFPSYEVITGNFNRGRYFEDDLREVKPEGVDHVMRLFKQHFYSAEERDMPPETGQGVSAAKDSAFKATLRAEIGRGAKVICDEELLDQR